MGKIRVLDDRLANQIAAGEVVERPASVVKELCENALDAGADRIQVTIEEGGIRSITVSDNGAGMDRDDAVSAFKRHATSKIRRERDLFAIRSLGFRGEALPSIASVSRLTMFTTDGGDGPGTRVTLKGGKLLSTEDWAGSRGTEVRVEDLFYNTPARLKYLKTVNTEVSHVADCVGRLALAHPSVSFRLKHKEKELFRTPGDGKRLHVLYALYGKQVARKMLSFFREDMDFTVSGLVGRPEVTRSNRSYVSTIINGRYIRSIPVVQSVIRAYDTLLPIGRYPIAVLSIEMDPKLVDVNVHPSKLEVRLSKEKELCRLVESGLKDLFQREVLIPKAEINQGRPLSSAPKPVQERLNWTPPAPDTSAGESLPSGEKVQESRHAFPASLTPSSASPSPVPDKGFASPFSDGGDREGGKKETPPTVVQEQPVEKPFSSPREEVERSGELEEERFPDLTPLTQVHGTYIIAQSEDGFYILDQHAAHERIYYELFSQRMRERDREQQSLLIPLTIECTPSEAELIQTRLSQMNEVGIEIESFGGTSFLVRSHPRWFPSGSEEDLIREIIDWMKSGDKVDTYRLRDDGAKMMACKAAIKANRHLNREEMESLLKQLQACRTPYTCPHGRPILVHFSTYEIEKMFKRVM
ncbi:DNA mismatch repair endonuclease MutL [Paludifilum halophilum]|uniref:DNA mismatch repair protein MutL n=1 Tax=Paludifilum halophilum TaxID=1642702 RepID=A0A235BC72_9BACL|nr:DNA mismatch repair endonuclease MutL [Paludifilum halophilum]OYD09537.1 DNA mismatch repair protein MutL [Paludifilum halophilum]